MAEKWLTVAPGIRVREFGDRLYRGKPDRYFTLRYKVGGKEHHESLGWASDGWNLSKAKATLAELKTAASTGTGPQTLRERRLEAERLRNEPTLNEVWQKYRETLSPRSLQRFESSVRRDLASIMPKKIRALRTADIEALTQELLEERKLAPATVRLSVSLIRQIVLWGAKHGLNEQPPVHELYFSMPKVDNQRTENLTDEELSIFWQKLSEYPDKQVAAGMKFALLTGVRRGAIFSLKWDDIDFDNKVIRLRGEHAKNHKTLYIPLSAAVEELLNEIRHFEGNFVFGQSSFKSYAIDKLIADIKPFLPEGFRPFHGLRHCYASRLASSGVPLYEIQNLLTHASPNMTQRYAHLFNESLRKAANIAGDVITEVAASKG